MAGLSDEPSFAYASAGSLRQDSVGQAIGLPAGALAKAGGEGSRTPVRNAVGDDIYTFSMGSVIRRSAALMRRCFPRNLWFLNNPSGSPTSCPAC